MKLQLIARQNDGPTVISDGQRDAILDLAGSEAWEVVNTFLTDLALEAANLRSAAIEAHRAHQTRERMAKGR